MQYAYFIGCLIIVAIWMICFFLRRDLWREMVWAGLLGMPFGFSEFLYVPEYWNPPSLFNLINKIGFGIESLMFAFFASGIAAVIYEIVWRRRTVRISRDKYSHILPYLIIVITYILLEFLAPAKTIYNAMIAGLLGSIIIATLRRDLIAQMILSGFIFGLLYFSFFVFFNSLFPQFVTEVYTLKNFWGISVAHVPLEEILFAFVAGLFWAPLYEFVRGYRTRLLPS